MEPKNKENQMIPCIMSEEIREIGKELSQMSGLLNDIKKSLVGDEFGNIGMISEVRSLKDRVDKLEKLRWVIAGFASAVGSGITILLSILF